MNKCRKENLQDNNPSWKHFLWKSDKRAVLNKWAEERFVSDFSSEQTQKLVCRVGKKSKNLKRACSFIKQVRVKRGNFIEFHHFLAANQLTKKYIGISKIKLTRLICVLIRPFKIRGETVSRELGQAGPKSQRGSPVAFGNWNVVLKKM